MCFLVSLHQSFGFLCDQDWYYTTLVQHDFMTGKNSVMFGSNCFAYFLVLQSCFSRSSMLSRYFYSVAYPWRFVWWSWSSRFNVPSGANNLQLQLLRMAAPRVGMRKNHVFPARMNLRLLRKPFRRGPAPRKIRAQFVWSSFHQVGGLVVSLFQGVFGGTSKRSYIAKKLELGVGLPQIAQHHVSMVTSATTNQDCYGCHFQPTM